MCTPSMRGYGLGTYMRSTSMRAPLAIASMRRKSVWYDKARQQTAERVVAVKTHE